MTNEPAHGHADHSSSPHSGRLADLVAAPTAAPRFSQAFPPATLAKIAVITALFVWLTAWQYEGLVTRWIIDTNWSHGFIIPLFSMFLIYLRWDELLRAPRRTCLWGLPIVLLAIVGMFAGVWPLPNAMLQRANMVFLLFGLVLYLAGPHVIRLTWLPILFLLFAVPLPDLIYGRIAGPLQEVAASGSTFLLRLFGVQIHATRSHLRLLSVNGNVHNLTVAEACAGMRLLMAFAALGVAMAYVETRPLWQRITLVLAGIPIAVLCNVVRVTITSTMYVLDKPELGDDFMHHFTGMLMLIPALVLLWLLSKLLQALFVEDEEEDASPAGTEGTA
ncbi:MAG: exosortase/archaeosortase family protein [Phycisphaerae bacterium]|nr:exosortase/archaeosortase family protein [Phycisphaerae bacterium]